MSSSNFSILRVLKLLKLARTLRIIRVFRFFFELRVMITLMLGSLKAIFWAVLILMLVIYIFGLLFCEAAADHISTSDNDVHNGLLREHYGGLQPR